MSSTHPFLSDSDKDAQSIGLNALKIRVKVLRDEISESENILGHIEDCLVPAAQSILEAAYFRLDKLKNQPRSSSLCGDCKKVLPFVCFNNNEMTGDPGFQGMMEEHHNCIYCGIEFRMASMSDSIVFLNEASRSRQYCSDVNLWEYLSESNDNYESVIPSSSNRSSYFTDHSRANTIQEENGRLENAIDTVLDQVVIASKNLDGLRYSILKRKADLRESKKAFRKVVQDLNQFHPIDDIIKRIGLGRRSDRLDQASEERKCNICLDQKKEIIFQCGHQACSSCSLRIQHCHVCRSTIQQRIKFYD